MATQPKAKQAWLPVFLLLLLVLLIVVFVLPSLNARVGTGTQTASEGQCLSGGQGFDTQQEAFTLAQTAEQYRATHPFGGNYGLSSYTICYTDGSQRRSQSPVFKGYNNPNSNEALNATHSEQSAYGWLQLQFSRLSIDQDQVTAIYAVIFSQVIVCPLCQQEMVTWQRTLRQRAKTQQVFLSVWDILWKKGFDPATSPAGIGELVTADLLKKVSIRFVP